jgi:hypothetical protein
LKHSSLDINFSQDIKKPKTKQPKPPIVTQRLHFAQTCSKEIARAAEIQHRFKFPRAWPEMGLWPTGKEVGSNLK